MHEMLRRHVFHWWATLVACRSRWVLGIGFTAALVSVAIAVFGVPFLNLPRLQFESDRNALISPDLEWNKRFIKWNETYRGTGDLTVVIDSSPDGSIPDGPQRARARQLADELGEALSKLEGVEHVVWRFDSSRLHPRALRMLGRPEFDRQLQGIKQAKAVLESPTVAQLIRPEHLVQRASQWQGEQVAEGAALHAINDLTKLIDSIDRTLKRQEAGEPLASVLTGTGVNSAQWQYLASENNRLLFVRITPHKDAGAISAIANAIDSIRGVIAQISQPYEGVEVGLTGIDVIEADETHAAMRDSILASAVAVALIGILLIGAFHSWGTPLLALVSLLMAIACSFGYLTLAIGHLQVISVVFTVILLGLGIAYGVHIVTRYELVRHRYSDDGAGFGLAMSDSLVTMGPGILTGAVTTAAAFATTMLTDFKGVAEMGHIAAAGIAFCMVAMFSVFPALLRLVKPRHRHVVSMGSRLFHLFEERWVMPFVRHPKTTLAAALSLTILSLVATSRMQFNYDLMALLPDGVDSVTWQQRVDQVGGRSIWYAVSIAEDLDDAARRVARFRTKATIDQTMGGVGLLFPPDGEQRIRMLRQVRKALGPALSDALGPADPTTTNGDLRTHFNALRQLMTLAASAQVNDVMRTALEGLDRTVAGVLDTLNQLGDDERPVRLRFLQERYAKARRHLAERIDLALDDGPLQIEDLPGTFRRLYCGSDGSLAIEVYPRLPASMARTASPLAPRFLPQFVDDLKLVDERATGVIVQIYESGDLIYRSYIKAGGWALLVVFILLCLDFYSLIDALLCLVPVLIGFAVTFGIMYVSGMPINPANIIVLPLMFGIGVDAGVHVLHRYRQDPTTRPLGLTAGTGKGITLTSLTTMIGFGALMIASHRGIRSLGFVLATGIGLTMLACWTVMPACLELRRRSVERKRHARLGGA